MISSSLLVILGFIMYRDKVMILLLQLEILILVFLIGISSSNFSMIQASVYLSLICLVVILASVGLSLLSGLSRLIGADESLHYYSFLSFTQLSKLLGS